MNPATRKKVTRVGLVVLGLALLAAIFSIGRGTAPAGDNKVVEADTAKPAEPAKKVPVADTGLQKQIDELRNQFAEARKANELLKKQLDEAKRAPKPVPPALVPVVVAPESATTVLKAIGMKAQTEDSIVKVWTGRPAVIHELAESNAKKTGAQKPTATAGSDTPKAELTAEAKEQKAQLEDLAVYLRRKLNDVKSDKMKWEQHLSTIDGEQLNSREYWRNQLAANIAEINKLKIQLTENQAKLEGLR